MKKITTAQKFILLEFLESNRELAQGKLTPSWTSKDATKLWEQLAAKLNSCPGATKTWKEWRKTWHDIKTNTKSRAVAITRKQGTTGADLQDEEDLTDFQKRVYALFGPTMVRGLSAIEETKVIFEFPVLNYGVPNVPVTACSAKLEDDQHIGVFVENEDPLRRAHVAQTPLKRQLTCTQPKSGKRQRIEEIRLDQATQVTQCFTAIQERKLQLKERELQLKQYRLDFDKERHKEDMNFKIELLETLKSCQSILERINNNVQKK